MGSSIVRGARLASRARARLALREGVSGAASGAFAGAAVGVIAAAAARLADVGVAPVTLWLPLVGAVIGTALSLRRTPDIAHAALELDRVGGTGESLVSALTAVDAPLEFRELAAERAIERLRSRPVRAWLPMVAPRFAAPAAACVALLAAVALLSSPDEETVGVVPGGGASAVVAPGDGAAASDGDADEPGSAVPVADGSPAIAPDGWSRDPQAPPPTDEELRRLAKDLAGRGSAEAARALALLRSGDRDGAESLLRSALTARDEPGARRGAGGSDLDPTGSGEEGAPQASRPSVQDRWSGARWPLRYDRQVRAAFETMSAREGDGPREDGRDEDRGTDR